MIGRVLPVTASVILVLVVLAVVQMPERRRQLHHGPSQRYIDRIEMPGDSSEQRCDENVTLWRVVFAWNPHSQCAVSEISKR